ncbi:MAG: endonuclease/exonuclease/phosphatase family protein, partial [Rhodocyclaceae bacterium]|nr:endonuclease/exonuclease/phosphatase family protein [Rhodocyclaceae bacterium]
GNAILSRFAILKSDNHDVSNSRLERRGLLHCEMDYAGSAHRLHCICVHLSLTAASRRRQMATLVERIEALVPADAPLIIAGDFNDWHNRADNLLAERLALTEVFCGTQGQCARSFPSTLPVFRLDRIYVRGFSVRAAEVHYGPPWSRISDHAALSAEVFPVPAAAPRARDLQAAHA